MSKICKKRVHGNDKKKLPWDFKKCTGSLHFSLLTCHHHIGCFIWDLLDTLSGRTNETLWLCTLETWLQYYCATLCRHTMVTSWQRTNKTSMHFFSVNGCRPNLTATTLIFKLQTQINSHSPDLGIKVLIWKLQK